MVLFLGSWGARAHSGNSEKVTERREGKERIKKVAVASKLMVSPFRKWGFRSKLDIASGLIASAGGGECKTLEQGDKGPCGNRTAKKLDIGTAYGGRLQLRRRGSEGKLDVKKKPSKCQPPKGTTKPPVRTVSLTLVTTVTWKFT